MEKRVILSPEEANGIIHISNNSPRWDERTWDIETYFEALEDTKSTRNNSGFTSQEIINSKRNVTEAKVTLWEQTVEQARDYLDTKKKKLEAELKRKPSDSTNIMRKIHILSEEDEVLLLGKIRGVLWLHKEDMSGEQKEELKMAVKIINEIRNEQEKTRDKEGRE